MGSVWLILGVPAGKRRSGFTLVAFCCGCSYFSSVSPHVENCVCFPSTAKRLPLQSLTQRQKCTSLYIFDCEFCLTSKHRVCLIPAASVPLLSVHPWHPLHMSLLIANSLLHGITAIHGGSELTSVSILGHEFFAVFRHGWRGQLNRSAVFQKQYFWKTRKSIYNMDVVNWCNLLLPNTTDILVRSELTSLSILGHEFFVVFRHGWRGQLNRNDVFQKRYFWKTRKSIYNMDVVNWRNIASV